MTETVCRLPESAPFSVSEAWWYIDALVVSVSAGRVSAENSGARSFSEARTPGLCFRF